MTITAEILPRGGGNQRDSVQREQVPDHEHRRFEHANKVMQFLWSGTQRKQSCRCFVVRQKQREACSQLRMQIGRLEVEAASRVGQLNKARQIQASSKVRETVPSSAGTELAHRGSYDQRQQ